MSEAEAFLKALGKDPSLLDKLKKTSDLEAFKDKYNTERATPLKCPACSVFFQNPGSLWINKNDHTKFVCKKCKLEFDLICKTLPNDSLIEEIRQVSKGEKEGLPSWMKES